MRAIRHWWLEWLAYWCQFLRRPDWAAGHWTRIADENPRHPRALQALAVLAARAGNGDAALALLDRQLSVRPDDASAWFNRGFLLQNNGEHQVALEAFERALAIDPKVDRAWYGKALSLIALERHAEAIEPLKRNTELQPMSPYGWYQLATLHRRLGDLTEARRIVRHLRGFEPQVATRLERELGFPVTASD